MSQLKACKEIMEQWSYPQTGPLLAKLDENGVVHLRRESDGSLWATMTLQEYEDLRAWDDVP